MAGDGGASLDWRHVEHFHSGDLRDFPWNRGASVVRPPPGTQPDVQLGRQCVSRGFHGPAWLFLSNRSIFFFVVGLRAPDHPRPAHHSPGEIDYELARGAKEGDEDGKPVESSALLKDRPLLIFLVCAVMFHFANAAMLPLLGEMLAKGQGRSSMMFMSACVVTTQLVITLLASWSGRKAGTWGRKPLLLIAFGVLPVRAVLYTLTANTAALVAIQILDGVGAGIFGVVSVLVIADLTRGLGPLQSHPGAISTAVGIGASLSQIIAGSIVHHFGSNAGFLFLAAVAAVAFGILYFFMPETRDKRFLNPTQGAPPYEHHSSADLSNVFMTFAWYGHLKYGHDWPLWKAILVSWAIALLEYCLAVPANRLGYGAVLRIPAQDHSRGRHARRLHRLCDLLSEGETRVELSRGVRLSRASPRSSPLRSRRPDRPPERWGAKA